MNVFSYVFVCSAIDVNRVLCFLTGQKPWLDPGTIRPGDLSEIVDTMHIRAGLLPSWQAQTDRCHSISTDVRTARRVLQMQAREEVMWILLWPLLKN